jgi:DNA-binding IclR family transcriptional regulator
MEYSPARPNKKNGSPGHGIVKSAARTLDILSLLAEQPDGMTMTGIGSALKIPPSSIHALIGTMLHLEFVLRDKDSSRYRLGPKILQLASSYRAHVDLITLADPVMEQIRNSVGESISLSVLQGQMIMFIHKKAAEGAVKVVNPVGTRLYAHATGSGKVMLAYLDEEELDRVFPDEQLPEVTSTTITDKSELKKHLIEIRKQNYAFDKEESAIGVWAVASCVRDDTGRPIAALSIVGPTSRIASKDVRTWHHSVRQFASEISLSLGYFEDLPDY